MRIVKFSIVGAVGIVVQLAVLSLLSRCGANYLLATALAVESAVLHNFWWHRRFTWVDRKTYGWGSRLWRFHATNAAISLVGNLAFMRLLVGGLHFNIVVASTISISVCAFVNYFASNRWVFAAVNPAPCGRASTPGFAARTGHK